MPRTRTEISSVTSPHLLKFIGEPANFTGLQLPTYRDAIKQAMMLQREDTRSNYKGYSLNEIMNDVYSLLLPIWEKANSDLVKDDAIVRKYSITRKMEEVWSDARNYVTNRLNKKKEKKLWTPLRVSLTF